MPLFLADKVIDACGAIFANYKFFPKAALVDEVKHQPRETFCWRANDSLLSMLWKDCKSILIYGQFTNLSEENQLNAK